jgi:hypothetical protein
MRSSLRLEVIDIDSIKTSSSVPAALELFASQKTNTGDSSNDRVPVESFILVWVSFWVNDVVPWHKEIMKATGCDVRFTVYSGICLRAVFSGFSSLGFPFLFFFKKHNSYMFEFPVVE